MTRFFAALSFLTRLPAPGAASFGPREVGRGALCFPLVGAIVGGITAASGWLLEGALPTWLVATLAVAVTIRCTGAFHQDALADFVDGFGGGLTREAVLRIMHDSSIGAYGTVALVLALLVRVGCTAALIDAGAWGLLVAAGALSRWPSVLMGAAFPYAHAEGKALGRALTDHIGLCECVGASASAVGIGAWLGPGIAGGGVLVCLAVGAWFSWTAMRRVGGVTGDTMGAATEACELATLVVAVGSVH
ncbi:MAG: adenosylcobinamide-GDP ribazoletransferase [Nannocystaceae bacterium]|nr:adenosylcobinamide-GDP ribazoletransferase [bacterium]